MGLRGPGAARRREAAERLPAKTRKPRWERAGVSRVGAVGGGGTAAGEAAQAALGAGWVVAGRAGDCVYGKFADYQGQVNRPQPQAIADATIIHRGCLWGNPGSNSGSVGAAREWQDGARCGADAVPSARAGG